MLEKLKRIALTALGGVGMLLEVLARRGRSGLPAEGTRLLRHLATHTSASVPDLSSSASLSQAETSRLLTDLERRRFVQLSPDRGVAHVRIAAITKTGREHMARL
jgi:DNA-binding MarR family transcriptional regulator